MTDVDYDGDGDVTEGVYGEIDTCARHCWRPSRPMPPKWHGDHLRARRPTPTGSPTTDGNGRINDEEGGFASWTPNLLRAAYNYQDSQKEPGATPTTRPTSCRSCTTPSTPSTAI
jgi:hypothetical protein